MRDGNLAHERMCVLALIIPQSTWFSVSSNTVVSTARVSGRPWQSSEDRTLIEEQRENVSNEKQVLQEIPRVKYSPVVALVQFPVPETLEIPTCTAYAGSVWFNKYSSLSMVSGTTKLAPSERHCATAASQFTVSL